MPKILFICEYCKKEFYNYGKRRFCSRTCSSKFSIGVNNPNYGNRWSEEKKIKHSQKIRKIFDDNPQYRYECGKTNRGKKFSKELIEKMHGHRSFQSYSRPKTEDTKRKIGIKSREKFTSEYHLKHRAIMESKGKWKPINEIEDIEIYYKKANWVDNSNFFSSENIELVNKYGIFNIRNNREGVVRDHIYSRWDGFRNGVFPEILRHPENCQIIFHRENFLKRTKSDITLNDLFNRIFYYKGEWKEQNKCLKRIKEYLVGKRWVRNNDTFCCE